MEHTELPWAAFKGTPEIAAFICQRNGPELAIVECGNQKENIANAEYIVRACNAFPAIETILLAIQAKIDSGEYLRADDPEYQDLKDVLSAKGE